MIRNAGPTWETEAGDELFGLVVEGDEDMRKMSAIALGRSSSQTGPYFGLDVYTISLYEPDEGIVLSSELVGCGLADNSQELGIEVDESLEDKAKGDAKGGVGNTKGKDNLNESSPVTLNKMDVSYVFERSPKNFRTIASTGIVHAPVTGVTYPEDMPGPALIGTVTSSYVEVQRHLSF